MVFYLFGPDTYRSKQKLTELKNKFLSEVDPTGMNLAIIEGSALTANTFKQTILTAPFLSKRRMVIITNLFGQKLSTDLVTAIVNYLNNKNKEPYGALLIFYQNEDYNKQNKAAQQIEIMLLKKSDHVQEFKLLKGKALSQWADKEAKARGKTLPVKTLNSLIKIAKNNLWDLSNKLDQLIAYLNSNPAIKDIDVNKLLEGADDEATIWQLMDMSLNRNQISFSELVEGWANKENGRRIKLLLLIKIYLENNLNIYDLGKLSYPPFVIKNSMAYAEKFSQQELINMYNSLLKIDQYHKKYNIDVKPLLNTCIGQVFK